MKFISLFSLLLALLLQTAGIVSQPCLATEKNAVSGKTETRQRRILLFPKDFSLGKLYTYKAKDFNRLENARSVIADELGLVIGTARGTVTLDLPPGAPIYLSASYELIKHPQVLFQLKPNIVDALSFGSFGVVEDLGKIYSPLAHLTGLRLLEVDVSDVNDEKMLLLKPLVNLESLSLTMCQVHGSCFQNLPFPKLLSLELSGNSLEPSTYASIARYKKLEWLSVGHTGADDRAVVELSKLKQLRHLGLTHCHISAKSLALIKTLPNLRELVLEGTPITVKDLLVLKGMALKHIVLATGKVTNTEKRRLQLALPETKISLPDQVDGETKELFAPLH